MQNVCIFQYILVFFLFVFIVHILLRRELLLYLSLSLSFRWAKPILADRTDINVVDHYTTVGNHFLSELQLSTSPLIQTYNQTQSVRRSSFPSPPPSSPSLNHTHPVHHSYFLPLLLLLLLHTHLHCTLPPKVYCW